MLQAGEAGRMTDMILTDADVYPLKPAGTHRQNNRERER